MKSRQIASLCAVALFLAVSLSPPCRQLFALPTKLELPNGESELLPLSLPGTHIAVDQGLSVHRERAGLSITPHATGHHALSLRWWVGPAVKTIDVEASPPYEVVPSGQSVGILIKSQGAIVVGFAPLVTVDGQTLWPAREAGVQLGDQLVRLDGAATLSVPHLDRILRHHGQEGSAVRLGVRRNDRYIEIRVRPQFDRLTRSYRLGLFLKSEIAGIGTLTFYDATRTHFLALGHGVVDPTSHQRLPVTTGRIVGARVVGIERGMRGHPGEKIALLDPNLTTLGAILQNSQVGLSGKLDPAAVKPTAEAMPLATVSQVHSGPAELWTVTSGHRVQRFRIIILRVMPQGRASGRGLLLKVTDPALLRLTGGIVQGMSGSPIVQDGRLVGAVTHVFVNNPQEGYGVFAEWMAQAAGLLRPAA